MFAEDCKRKLLLLIVITCLIYIIGFYRSRIGPWDFNFHLIPSDREEQRTFIANDYEADICWYKRYRQDWRTILNPCYITVNDSISRIGGFETDASKSYVETTKLSTAGSFTYLLIRSVDIEGNLKRIGGDSWRVKISGKANISSSIVDKNDGTYLVQILFPIAGMYEVNIALDYTLCQGLEDPPLDWFKKGNAQGKYQPRELPTPNNKFLMSPMDNCLIYNIVNETQGIISNHHLTDESESICDYDYPFVWEGIGSWQSNEWISRQSQPTAVNTGKHQPKKSNRKGILLTYGDSVAVYFARSLSQHLVCKELYNCEEEYNWIYPIDNVTIAKSQVNDEDFEPAKIIDHITDRILLNSSFNRPNSVLILNFGLHFVESVRFVAYQGLLEDVVALLLTRNEGVIDIPTFQGKIIWKTTTSIYKERATLPQLHWRRFFTNPRIKLYNAYAIDLMSESGIPVVDVYPISDSYPYGAGTHAGDNPAKNDIVHYNDRAFYPAEDAIYNYVINYKL